MALPLAVAAFLFVPVVGNFNQAFTALCIAAAYTACSILLMIILTNMCYRQGISALWLFCIERSVRMIFNALGREARDPILELSIGIDSSYILSIVVVILVIVSSIILLTERSITAQWGIGIKTSDARRAEEIVREDLLKNRSREIALNYRLSLREEEILTLLAQRKRNTAIASELFISEQTVKTHIRNLYKKLDVHSRDELFDLVESIDAKRAIASSVDEDYR
ncbi:response regulator transcription factor [Slackia piriformis]|uniref:helix-turn-helix transcriptional regulator n=1 Tax=Slackia piriformis TaxID=626934 RepID=UPI0039F4AC61